MLRRREFSILKEFKGEGIETVAPGAEFEDRRPFKFKKLEQDLRAHGKIKWKHAMHLMRLLLSGISALREGELRVRLDEHRAALLAIKRGEKPWPEVNAWRLRLHKEFDEEFVSTQLPERPDYAWANEFLL